MNQLAAINASATAFPVFDGFDARSSNPSAKDRSARDRLVADHLAIVHAVAGRMKNSIGRSLPIDDLVAYGSGGLVEAADRFDPSRGIPFSGFAFHRIRGAIIDGVRRAGWYSPAECAKHRQENLGKQNDNAALAPVMAATHANDRNDDVTAQLTSIAQDLSQVARVYITSLEFAHDGAEEGLSDLDALASEGGADPETALQKKERAQQLRRFVARLPEKERELIERYYFAGETLQQAGQAMGHSKFWASRLHARVLKRLKTALLRDGEVV